MSEKKYILPVEPLKCFDGPVCDYLYYNPETLHRINETLNANTPWIGGSCAGIAGMINRDGGRA